MTHRPTPPADIREKRKTRGRVTHDIAECRGCDWRSEDYVAGQEKARAHNKRTGHEVRVEIGTVYTIKGNTGKATP